MLDIKFIRENPKEVKEGCKKKGVDCDIDKILDLDKERRKFLGRVEELRARQNKVARLPARQGKEGIEEGKKIKAELKNIEPDLQVIEKKLDEKLRQMPNIPSDKVPLGKDESDNKIIKKWGDPTKFVYKPKDHLELGEELDIIDVKRAAKVAGSRFGYLKGDAVLLEFALVDLVLKTVIKEGFVPIVPPVLIKEEAMRGMGYIDTPEDLAERYHFEKDNLFLVGTGEHSVGPMHADEVFDEAELPKRYAVFSTCFREEAGSYGKDTKGILRVHQFDKVELFSFCHPGKSKEELEFLVAIEEKLWQALKIPYQVVQLCTGDLARPSAETIDIEAWLPGQPSTGSGQGQYREVSSASNTTDFQARRLNIRFRKKDGGLDYVHMLNATGLAVGRTLIAIMENNQQEDGTIKIPTVLQKYVGKKKIS